MKKGNPIALLPIGVFLVLYLGLGLLFEYGLHIPMGFYNIPIVIAFLVAILVACLQNRAVPFEEKLVIMGQGVGDKNIITMLLIFLTAGAFVGVVGRSSAQSVAYFMLDIIPPGLPWRCCLWAPALSPPPWEPPSAPSPSSCPLHWRSPRRPASTRRCVPEASWAEPCSATTCPSSPTPPLPPATVKAAP